MEIEKKYTIRKLPDNLEQYACVKIEQGYLCKGPIVRIRRWNEDYILTYKSKSEFDEKKYGTKITNEVELPLTKEAYEHLKEKVDGSLIVKDRYLIPLSQGRTAELDCFHGHLEGLCFAEVEFDSIEQAEQFVCPEWFDEDVSLDRRYANYYLSTVSKWNP